mmetsp:Transcript_33230/g.109008  ORF Transcript_33230/g.109008 Transcript_33230/m.109008 type:complete len:242 (+) Transcript_33230:1-726(+)
MFSFGVSDFCTLASIVAAVSGGVLLGCSVVFKTGALSGVMGISNYTRRLMFQVEMKRYAFTVGMILAGIVMSLVYGAVEPLPPPSFDTNQRVKMFLRLGIGSFIVGLGASMQHGCTSGHGLTGLACLSLRSWLAVPTFMAAGMLTATLSQSAQALPPDSQIEAELPKWYIGSAVAASSAVVLAIIAAVFRCVDRGGNMRVMQVAMLFGEVVVGLTFGCGLVISGMARHSKAFLDWGSGAGA